MPITLKPGLLVSLTSSIEGGVRYSRRDLDAEGTAAAVEAADTAEVERWETIKVTDDAEEHERAVRCQRKARGLIEAVCKPTPFGLLLYTSTKKVLGVEKIDETALDEAITASRAVIAEFHATARHTRITVWPVKVFLASSDAEAAKGLASEIKSLLAAMDDGIKARDADAIREASRKARLLAQLLDESAGEKVTAAIAEARAAAREIAKTVEDRGTAADLVLQADQAEHQKALRAARALFLDMEAPVEVEALPVAAARAVDVAPEAPPVPGTLVEKVGIEEALPDDAAAAAPSVAPHAP